MLFMLDKPFSYVDSYWSIFKNLCRESDMCRLELKANFLGREKEKKYWLGVGRPPPLTTVNDIVCP